MPVELALNDSDVDLEPGTPESNIVAFLYRHSDCGYTSFEVQDALELPFCTVKGVLRNLHEENHIGRTTNGDYYALTRHETLFRYVSCLDQRTQLFEQSIRTENEPQSPTLSDDELEVKLEDVEQELADVELESET